MKFVRLFLVVTVVAVLGVATAVSAQADPVDLEFSLVVDVSGSISTTEYNLQMDGYAAAFANSGIQNAILSTAGGDFGKIAVNLIFFSTTAVVGGGWTLLDSVADINAWSSFLGSVARPGGVGSATSIVRGMDLSTGSFAGNGYEGTKLIMDVSGDGTENVFSAAAVGIERDQAFAAGITVNGLAIGGGGLVGYYNTNVRTSDGFVIQSLAFTDFEDAIIEKIGTEVGAAVPEPGSLALLGTALASLMLVGRRRRRKSA